MSNDPAQWEIVLRELRIAGPRGVHTFELRRMFIGNPSQRIAELEKRGYEVTSTRERLDGKAIGSRYVLVSEPGSPAAPSPPDPPPQGGMVLWDTDVVPSTSNAIYGDDWDAAA